MRTVSYGVACAVLPERKNKLKKGRYTLHRDKNVQLRIIV